jgi:hypothetical protein
MTCGPAVVGWYEVGDLEDDGCGKTSVVLEKLDDHTKYSVLAYGVRRGLPV